MDPKTIGARIKQAYPQYANVDETSLGNKYLQKYGGAVSGVQTGKLKLTDIPEAQRVGVSLGLEEPAQTAEKTQINEVKDTIGNIDTVLGKNLSTVAGPGGVLGLIPGTKSYTTRGQIQQIKDQLSLASVGKLKGQGQVSDAERRLLANASSNIKFGMNPGDLREELNKVRGILGRNIGETGAAPDQGVQDNLSIPGVALSGADALTKLLFPETRKALTPEAMNKILAPTIPLEQTKGNLGKSVEATLKSFPNLLKGVVPAGVELGSYLGLSGLGKKGVGKAGEVISRFTPKGAAGARATEAVKSTAKISGNKLISAATQYVENDPTAAKLLQKIIPTLEKKSLSVTELVDKMKIWTKAYSAAGRVGNSAKAGLYDALQVAAKDELAAKAPRVLAAHKDLAKALGRSKILSRIINPITVGSAAASATTYGLLNKLGAFNK